MLRTKTPDLPPLQFACDWAGAARPVFDATVAASIEIRLFMSLPAAERADRPQGYNSAKPLRVPWSNRHSPSGLLYDPKAA
jgi:hypothetical protein